MFDQLERQTPGLWPGCCPSQLKPRPGSRQGQQNVPAQVPKQGSREWCMTQPDIGIHSQFKTAKIAMKHVIYMTSYCGSFTSEYFERREPCRPTASWIPGRAAEP